MAIVGGGPGGPLGSSNSFVGPQEALELVGSHCYAYSGVVQSAGSQSEATSTTNVFTTGNYYADVILSWGNDQSSGTADNFVLVKMNGAIIYQIQFKEGADANETNPKNLHFIIPSYTEVELLVGTSGDPKEWTMVLAGRIYRG
tara:strand:- start:689 stop:1120 length:432 start_codon:yes stop_codon:yes gene_type:complete